MDQLKITRFSESGRDDTAMNELQEALNLPAIPRRIECYDISNIQGTNAVGSMVVFENGSPNTRDYRRFQIKTVQGVDDYSMMREMLTRRFRRLVNPDKQSATDTSSSSKNSSWMEQPDLVLIDGGKGHLSSALQVFLELGIQDIPIASLAKENEELFVPQTPEPIVLPRNSNGLFLVQRARDEAHRFAITYHRKKRAKTTIRSSLDMIPGVGPKRRKHLLRKFGSVRNLSSAHASEIASTPGITMKLAEKIKLYI
jgi:excinuclease ABC subunit C